MDNWDYFIVVVVIVALSFIVYISVFQESNVEEKIETSPCEKLKDGYVNHNLCKNSYGQDVCRGKLLFEYMDRCLDK